MKLNRAERLVVNNPFRAMEQKIQIRWLKKIMPLRKGAIILEIGCGRGVGAKLILDHFHPSWLHTMDLDMEMVLMAKNYLSTKRNVTLSVGDASSLPFGTGSFDAVFGFGFLHHVPDWRRALEEISRVLKPRGVYFFEELYPPLYLNFITRTILQHPRRDRFFSHDLRETLAAVRLPIKKAFEFRRFGILAVAVKEAGRKQ